jgi:hypothetical protein
MPVDRQRHHRVQALSADTLGHVEAPHLVEARVDHRPQQRPDSRLYRLVAPRLGLLVEAARPSAGLDLGALVERHEPWGGRPLS